MHALKSAVKLVVVLASAAVIAVFACGAAQTKLGLSQHTTFIAEIAVFAAVVASYLVNSVVSR